MSMFGKIFSKAQRYAQQNPDKVRGLADKAARFADKQTKGKYRSQIDNAVRKVDGVTGGGRPRGGPQQPGHPGPHRDGPADPYRDDPRFP